MFELARNYNFTKFIILVPSVAIREGVNTSVRLMREHFRKLYPDFPFDATIYRGDSAEEVQSFATSTNLQILIMTIASIRGDKNNRIIHQPKDRLNGLCPIDYLKATRPVVIMDEPQNMESLLSQSSVDELVPTCKLRFSATHRKQRNVAYRLDPVDAHDLELVKQIVVADIHQEGIDSTPHIRLVEVKGHPIVARVELACRKADGSLVRRILSLKRTDHHKELSGKTYTDNPAYDGWRVENASIASYGMPGNIQLTNHGELYEGESIGGASRVIYKEMIRETVKEHFRKEFMLRGKGIKVLSLFFVDKVASYLGTGVNNDDANGDFVTWFDEVFMEERAKSERWQELIPNDPSEIRKAYFAQLKTKGETTFIESNPDRVTGKEDDAFELIMQDKERLLDQEEPVRFIFSHSALKEGWDNPNVFQICTLREMGKEVERRQTIGRGLRLPVSKTPEGFVRVADRSIAILTVVANESYQSFATNLQREYVKANVEIGQVRKTEFAKIAAVDSSGAVTDDLLGYNRSVEIWNHLESKGFIKEGKITTKFLPDTVGFDLSLPEYFLPYEDEIISLMRRATIEKYVRPTSTRQPRHLNKEIYDSPQFRAFWETISRRTTYRVSVDRERLIENAVTAIQSSPPVDPLRIVTTYADVKIIRGGAKGSAVREGWKELNVSYDLPDIVSELQQATSLTRATIIDILIQTERLDWFLGNPNDFIAMAKRKLQDELAKLVVEGIQYETIAGSVYELRELQDDGEAEKERFLDQLYKVQNGQKTDFDYVLYESEVERQFAEYLDRNPDVNLFMKLPAKFQIPTPVGPYNPDWAIIKNKNGKDRIYMIRETKSTLDDTKLRPAEVAKMKSAKKHFEAIGVEDYGRSVPSRWNI
jgi:type III restriction enzyme